MSPSPEEAVKSVVRSLTDCWNRHDMVAYAAQFSDDADFVNVLGAHMKGRAAIEAQHLAIHRTIFRNSRLRELETSVRLVASDVALAHVRWEMTGHDQVPDWNVPESRVGILTCVLVEEGGRWLITALQNTDKTSVDLGQAAQ